ncbi:Uncharacterised protein [Shigella sonnei]|nr:Uncharacterised protein [Shigella sonnei]
MIYKRPDKVGKRFAVLFHLQVRPRITNNCLNFPSMADNPGVLYQSFDILFLHCCDLHRIELMKAGAIVFAFFEDGDPR